MKNAPRVISRVGSMQNLVDHVLQPTVGNYFRNSAQEVTVLEFLSARSERQREAFENIKKAIEAYDVECIDTLIGDIVPPAELMKTQTDRKIADELERTYDAQREAQVKRQALERETRGRQHAGRGRALASRWCASPSRTRSRRPKSAQRRGERDAAARRGPGRGRAAERRRRGGGDPRRRRRQGRGVPAGHRRRSAPAATPRCSSRRSSASTA